MNTAKIQQLEIALCKEKNQFGTEYDQYFNMDLDQLCKEHKILSEKEFRVRQIKVQLEAINRRSNGIDCQCSVGILCKECSKHYD